MSTHSKMPFARSALAVADMFLDGGPEAEPGLRDAVDELARALAGYQAAALPLGAVAAVIDQAGRLAGGKPLHRLDRDGRARVLALLERIPGAKDSLWLASIPYKVAYLLQDGAMQRMGARYGLPAPAATEKARWRSQITRAKEAEGDIELEAEAVVLGTGAGGAAAAYELASRGMAVAMVESGDYYDRRSFDGKYLDAFKRIYRFHPAIGNGVVTLITGDSVGGTTTINSGTCFRTPEDVLRRWQYDGLADFTPAEMAPYFDAVETMVGVEEASASAVGPLYDTVRKGAAALGYRDVHRLHRNATGCDGQGLCQFGCPTDAKRSTNVSYVPAALNAGAVLYAGFKAERILRDGNRVTGVTGTGRRADGSAVRLTIKAPNVIVSMGTLYTPIFLQDQGVRNPHLGRHLTVHPTGLVGGIVDGVDFMNERSIPQGVGMGDLGHEGIRFEGATPPLSVYGAGARLSGAAFRKTMEAYPNTAFFGFMISDKSEGRVLRGPQGRPIVTYSVDKGDLKKYVKAMSVAARIMFRAGAHTVNMFTGLKNPLLASERELDAWETRKWKARDFNMSAYHPLGTARLGATPLLGVCDADHRVFGWEGLYVMDGSNIPSSLGVNPQITIMAMAVRAAQKLATRQSTVETRPAEAV